MKKIIRVAAIVSLASLIMVGFASCKRTKCEMCGVTAFCKEKEILGQKVYICSDCEDEFDEANDQLGELADALKD